IIAIKKNEVGILEKECSPAHVSSRLEQALKKDWETLKHDLGKFTPEGTGINIPTFFKDEMNLALKLVPSWTAKAWDFTRIKSERLAKDIAKKAELANAALSAMDVDPPASSTLQKTIDDAVKAALRQQNKSAGQKRGRQQAKGKQPGNKKKAPPSTRPKPKPKGVKPLTATFKVDKRKRQSIGRASEPSKKGKRT
ncbi:hypothetical protein C7212DRAFT_346566, partial [Tuber magnatum]